MRRLVLALLALPGFLAAQPDLRAIAGGSWDLQVCVLRCEGDALS